MLKLLIWPDVAFCEGQPWCGEPLYKCHGESGDHPGYYYIAIGDAEDGGWHIYTYVTGTRTPAMLNEILRMLVLVKGAKE